MSWPNDGIPGAVALDHPEAVESYRRWAALLGYDIDEVTHYVAISFKKRAGTTPSPPPDPTPEPNPQPAPTPILPVGAGVKVVFNGQLYYDPDENKFWKSATDWPQYVVLAVKDYWRKLVAWSGPGTWDVWAKIDDLVEAR